MTIRGLPRLLIISPAKNEAQHIAKTIESIAAQTLKPTLWVIVDDDSQDATASIAESAAKEHSFIRVVRRNNRAERVLGKGVIDAFYAGLNTTSLKEYDFLCKLDADLELKPEYFSLLIERFRKNPRLGTASGKTFVEHHGRIIYERTGDEFSHGSAKLYRRECFEEIGGFVNEVMWDGIDCHRCRMLGWEAASFHDPELSILHLRRMGASVRSIYHGRVRWGRGQYFMGTGIPYIIGIAFYRMLEPPWIIGGVLIFVGYLMAWFRRNPRYEDKEFRTFLRQWQLKQLYQRFFTPAHTMTEKRLAYLISEYPGVSHTFVLREVKYLRQHGLDIQTASVRKPGDLEKMGHAEQEEAKTTFYIQELNILQMAFAHIGLFMKSPLSYFKMARRAAESLFDGPKSIVKALGYFVEAGILVDWLRKKHIPHIHVHFCNPAATVAYVACAFPKIGFSVTAHGPSDFFNTSISMLPKKLKNTVFVRCISQYCQSQVMRFLPVDQFEKISVIRLGVDLQDFTSEKKTKEKEVPHLLCVGRLVPEKGQSILLLACKNLKDLGFRFRLHVIGTGPSLAALEKLRAKLDLDGEVFFHGPLSQADVKTWYSSSDIFVLPSFNEGLPVVLMEAMAHELAVVTSNIDGTPEIVEDGYNGLLVTASDTNQLTDKLAALIRDPQLRKKLGSKGRETVARHYDLRVNTLQLERVFRKYVDV